MSSLLSFEWACCLSQHGWAFTRLLVAAVSVTALGVGGCGQDRKLAESSPLGLPSANYSAEEKQFIDSVLVDGVITRDEAEAAVQHLAACYVDGGLTGEILYDVSKSTGVETGLRVRSDHPVKGDEARGDMSQAVSRQCEANYDPVFSAFIETADVEAMNASAFEAAMRCMGSDDLADVAARIPAEVTTYDGLLSWAEAEVYRGDAGPDGLTRCLYQWGLDPVPIEVVAGR